MRETERYQNDVKELLERIFGVGNVIKECNVAKDSKDDFDEEKIYCPRIDIATHLYNKTGDVENGKRRIDDVYKKFQSFVEKLGIYSNTQIDVYYNENPRCFLAIEIEKRGSRKHMIGDIINACSIGKIGIIIPWDDKALTAFRRIKAYLNYIKNVKKIPYFPMNLVIISKEDFKNYLEKK